MTSNREEQKKCAATRPLLPNSPLDQALRLLAKAIARRLVGETSIADMNAEAKKRTLPTEAD